jgi:hypothetical protein
MLQKPRTYGWWQLLASTCSASSRVRSHHEAPLLVFNGPFMVGGALIGAAIGYAIPFLTGAGISSLGQYGITQTVELGQNLSDEDLIRVYGSLIP